MFKKLIKNKKAQNTAEYAILISLVVAGIVAMQTYAQRALQARVRDAAQFMSNSGNGILGNAQQYEPYYLNTQYENTRRTEETRLLDNEQDRMDVLDNSIRVGRDIVDYNREADGFGDDF